ncbi:thioredoxin [Ligilactobacillus cholophilus]|uniref:thioredoxin n=1 Tax=Ligilactobacillus cholophilus TaxID=3050131 RepID=UPI0025B26165|nr:thioredoxin [Ligilactobacillus cholophilus]
MSVKELTDSNFEEETANGITFTDFWATWCGPCRMQSPVIDELAKELDGKVKFTKMDIDQNPNTATELGIMSIPTMVIKKDGKIVDSIVGYHDKAQLEQIINQYL